MIPWRTKRACVGVPLDVFFPAKPGPHHTDPAAEICASCPVRTQCLTGTMAQEAGEQYRYGYRGGMTHQERSRLAQQPSWSYTILPIRRRLADHGRTDELAVIDRMSNDELHVLACLEGQQLARTRTTEAQAA